MGRDAHLRIRAAGEAPAAQIYTLCLCKTGAVNLPETQSAPLRPGESRCRRRDRPQLPVDGLRPTDVIGSFFVAGLALIVVAVAAAVVNSFETWTWGRWLALHLVFVGGISQLILGASQFFAGAFLATDPPSRMLIRGQLVGWNLGTIMLAVAVPTGNTPFTYLAVALLLAALTIYAVSLLGMRRRSLGSAPWASRWYLAAASFFAVGIVAGAMIATGVAWRPGNLLGAHMVLNLGGWFGTAIVGTLHTFFPSLTGSRLRFPRLQGPTFVAWSAGIAALVIGYAFSVEAAAQSGWLALALSAAMLSANIVGSLVSASRTLPLAAKLVGAAQLFLIAGLLVICTATVGSGASEALAEPTRAAAGILLVAGWIGLTVIGSLLHLLALLIRVRDLRRGMPQTRPLRDTALTVLAVAGVSCVAAERLAGVDALEQLAVPLLICAYVLLGARVAYLTGKVLVIARPQP
jgi:nitrite reductase (NO-forming)